MQYKKRVIICGAGIAGISAAYFLSRAGVADVLLVDERAPLTLTSDRSTECYRNWWPDPAMLGLMNRSIELLDGLMTASGDAFRMNRRGYVYFTEDPETARAMETQAAEISRSGGGPLRIHDRGAAEYLPGESDMLRSPVEGADFLRGTDAVQRHFPYVAPSTCAALHVRRAGWLSAQQLGMYLLERGRAAGVQFRRARVTSAETPGRRVKSIRLEDDEELSCDIFINAAGPFFGTVGAMLGLSLPVEAEVHLKVAFEDHLHVVPRDAPLLIWNDAQTLPWKEDELEVFGSDPDLEWLTERFPAGAHTRPEGGDESSTVLMLWDYRTEVIEPIVPVPLDDQYPEIVLRGLSRMLPGLRAYVGRAPRPRLDGGYYVRTRENRPLIGPTPVEGAYLIGALSGFGIMSACAAGELLARHVCGEPLPNYADAFALGRYDDPHYADLLSKLDARGEL